MKCSQCEKPALVLVGPADSASPLCNDCNAKFQATMELKNQQLMREMNHLTDTIEATTGVYGLLPKFDINPPQQFTSVQPGGITLNNIHIKDSTVGVVNTGSVNEINQVVNTLYNSGTEDLANHLSALTQSVLDNTEINQQTQADVVEILKEIARKSTLPQEERPKAVIKPLLLQLSTLIGGISGISEIWEQAKPVLEAFFNLN